MPLGGISTFNDLDPNRGKLRQEIEIREQKVTEIKLKLPTPQSEIVSGRALKSYARYFSQISSDFIGFSKRKGNPYYIFLNSSDGPKNAAKEIIKSAKSVAKLFERYEKRPNNYSQVECELAIDYLLAELGNLKFYCSLF